MMMMASPLESRLHGVCMQLAVLDEATSALDTATETRVFESLGAAGITILSAGHRASLNAFHRHKIGLITPASSETVVTTPEREEA